MSSDFRSMSHSLEPNVVVTSGHRGEAPHRDLNRRLSLSSIVACAAFMYGCGMSRTAPHPNAAIQQEPGEAGRPVDRVASESVIRCGVTTPDQAKAEGIAARN